LNRSSANALGKKASDNALRLKQAVELVWKSAPGWTVAAVVLIILQGSLPLLALYLMKLIVDGVSSGAGFEAVMLYIGLAGGVALLVAVCNSLASVVSEAQSIQVSDSIQEILHAKSVEVDLEYYENPKYYEMLHRAQQEGPSRPTQIVNGLLQSGRNGMSLLGVLALMVSVNWLVALLLCAAALPSALIQVRYARKLYHWQRACTRRERAAWYRHWLLTSDGYAKEVRLFDLGSLFMRQYREIREAVRKERLAIIYSRSIRDLASQAVALTAVFACLAYIANQTLAGVITLGSMVMYFGAVQQGQSFLSSFMSSLARLYESNLFLTNLQEFLQLKPKVIEPSHPRKVPCPIEQGICFENVGFGFPGASAQVLKNINLQIRPGQMVALVGENGSGKSTLIKLLCRLYDPQEGRITLDGIDLRDFNTVELRREMSILFQDYSRYNLTAGENIWLGKAHLPPVEEMISAAAQSSGADEFISSLDKKYETVLGKWFDGGIELSVGEWQKVALARAFVRSSQIIVLDEPTSSLDPRAEDDVIRKFRILAEGKIAIIISHRLSTVTAVDSIYFIKDGRIVQSGSHRALMQQGGEYARLFEIQARHYRCIQEAE
jgi:ATP-binding cassette subfamily B protein